VEARSERSLITPSFAFLGFSRTLCVTCQGLRPRTMTTAAKGTKSFRGTVHTTEIIAAVLKVNVVPGDTKNVLLIVHDFYRLGAVKIARVELEKFYESCTRLRSGVLAGAI
jgi:hypothetical protein